MKPIICLPPMVKEHLKSHPVTFYPHPNAHESGKFSISTFITDQTYWGYASATPELAIEALETALLKQEETKS